MNVRWFLKLVYTASLLLLLNVAAAQDLQIRGGFAQDSTRVGEETIFYLAAQYPSQLNLLFPDTSFNFSPFEYRNKKYFATKTEKGKSYDSVVYYLATFEVDSIQTLKLPVFQLNQQDCTSYASNRDSIFLATMVRKLPDSLTSDIPVRATVAYQDVHYELNYPVLIICVALLAMVAAVVWFAFGDKIRRRYRIKRLQKLHQQFISIYTNQLANIQQTFSAQNAESALVTWKKYMEQLNGRPYTKLTTRETTMLEKDELLGNNLRAVDGAIYGHNTRVVDSLEKLKSYADARYQQKVEEVKHG